jgi:hypothetical protein
MLDANILLQSQGLESGLRSGQAIGQMLGQYKSKNALQEAQARINAGEDYNAVIQQLMAKDPAAAQQLMNLKQGSMNLDAQAQEMEALKQRYGMEKLQPAGMSLMAAIMQDDPKIQDKLIDETAERFKGQSDGVYESLQSMKSLDPQRKMDALTGTFKMLKSAGIFPEDPSQMMQQSQPADVAKFEYWKQLNPNATEQQQRDAYERIINPYERSFASGMGAGQARIATEQGLNPILGARKAGEVEAIEGTATGQAELKSAQLEADKAQNLAKEEETRKAKQIDLSRQAATLAKEIANSPQLGSVTGVMAETPTFNPQSRDLIIKAQQLVAMLTAENLKLMSGVLTQADMELLQTLSTGLRVDDKGIKGSEQAVATQLNALASKIEKTLAEKAGSAPSQQPSATRTPPANVGRFKIEVE